jgi:hypothetical protein
MSTMTLAQTVLVPAVAPQPLPFNLLTVAQEIPTDVEAEGGVSERVLNGLDLWAYPPDEGQAVESCIPGSTIQKDEGGIIKKPKFGGMTGYVPISCSTFGNLLWDEFQARANAALNAEMPAIMEAQLVAGTWKNDQPYLGDTFATDWDGGAVSGTGVLPAEALARLEEAIGLSHRAGVIHATPGTVGAWAALGAIEEKPTGQLRTLAGTPVVKGAGYIDKTPAAVSAAVTGGNQWAWASSPVLYRLGAQIRENPPFIGEAMDRVQNDLTYRAERDFVVAFDPNGPQVAVLVDRSP